MANFEIAGARYRSVIVPQTSLEKMTMCGSSVNENPMSAVVSLTGATASSSFSFRLISFSLSSNQPSRWWQQREFPNVGHQRAS